MKRFLIFLLSISVGQVYAQAPTRPAAPAVVNYGWVPPSPEERALAQDNVYTQQLRELVKYNDDSDALIYRYYYKVKEKYGLLTELEKTSGRLASLDQGQTGSCCAFAATRALQITAACDILLRHEQEVFKVDFSPNAIYGIIRLDNLGRWDGANGTMIVDGLRKYGSLHSMTYGQYDLSTATDKDARRWAAVGLPKELIEEAKKHQIIACAPVNNVEEVKAALLNGYGVVVCSGISYSSKRSSDGFSERTPEGWRHALSVVSYRSKASGREGFLIQNSWSGPEGTWIGGPIYPEDMCFGSFWASPENLALQLKERDSYAIAGYNGFKRRDLKWDEIFKIGEEINVEDN